MKIEILHIDDCPNSDEVQVRVRRAVEAAGVTDAEIVATLLRTSEDAAATLFAGSPTVLVNGVDAFPGADRTSDLACRIYPAGDGFDGLPTTEQLVAVLREKSRAAESLTYEASAPQPDAAASARR